MSVHKSSLSVFSNWLQSGKICTWWWLWGCQLGGVIIFLERHSGEVSAALSIEGSISKDYGLFCGQDCGLSMAGISGSCCGGPQKLSLLVSSYSPFLPLRRNSKWFGPSQWQIWQTGTQSSSKARVLKSGTCKIRSLVLEHGYTTATVWSARVDRSTVGLDSWSMGLAEVIQVPGVGHRSGMGSWITGWKAVFQAQWARCKSMVGPSPNSGTRGHGTEEKQYSSSNSRSKISVRTLGFGTKSSCSAACDVGQNPDLRPKGGMQSREILVLVMARQSHNLRPGRLAWRSICCLIDDEAQWHPVIGEQSTAVTSAPVGRSTYRERAPAPRSGRERERKKKKVGILGSSVSWV